MMNVKVGDEVRVFDVNGSALGQPEAGWPGTVAKVGRKYFTVTYGRRTTRFLLETGRIDDAWAHRSVKTLERATMDERWRLAGETLRLHRIDLRAGHRLTIEQVEALAELAGTFVAPDSSTSEEG